MRARGRRGDVVQRLQAGGRDDLRALRGDVRALRAGALRERGRVDPLELDAALRRRDELRRGVHERDVVVDRIGDRVRERADHGRVRRLVDVGREVGVQERVRLRGGQLDRDHVARRGRRLGRDAILAQPCGDSLGTRGRGSNKLLNLDAQHFNCQYKDGR